MRHYVSSVIILQSCWPFGFILHKVWNSYLTKTLTRIWAFPNNLAHKLTSVRCCVIYMNQVSEVINHRVIYPLGFWLWNSCPASTLSWKGSIWNDFVQLFTSMRLSVTYMHHNYGCYIQSYWLLVLTYEIFAGSLSLSYVPTPP